MNVSLPDEMKQHVDSKVREGSFGSSSEYIRDLIRRDQERQRLRELLLDGATSELAGRADDAYFDALRSQLSSS